MGEKPTHNDSWPDSGVHAAPALLVTLEPRGRAFCGNVADFLWPWASQPAQGLMTAGEFWPDVFVQSRLPWGRFVESAIFHAAAIMVVWSSVQLWPESTRVVEQARLRSPEVLYYEAPEYLPPLDTGGPRKARRKGDPEFSRQAIISVPPEPDNRKQTIVAPPKLKLDRDVPLPNVVAWNQAAPSVPMAATNPAAKPKVPVLAVDVVAPPPEVENAHANRAPVVTDSVVSPPPELNAANSRRTSGVSQPAVVDPPPSVEPTATRRMGDLNIAASQVVAPAPQLPMEARLARPSAIQGGTGQVVPPPPSVQGTGGKDGRLIALNLHPAAASGPVEAPAGNRLGTFAATPQGKPGAVGTPDVAGDAKPWSQTAGVSGGKSGWRSAGVPPGLQVGAAPTTRVAEATLPASLAVPHRNSPGSSTVAPTELERKVFGERRLYAMTLNTPNLNSAGGSWVMHFAEYREDPLDRSELTAPVATQEVDPGYPLELMRQNVQGTVTLSAVIRSDGTVGEVRVLSGVDDRLDQYASAALGRWKFRPAEKNGKPVALQAVVKIPFRPMKRSGF
jgi:TonB family protein